MKVLAYKGKSAVSLAIKFQTRSPYSHVAIQLQEHEIYEAWHTSGVRRLRYPVEGHSRGTPIDIYRVDTDVDCDIDQMRSFLQKQVGKKYDFKSVARFLTRRKVRADDRWFCSELVLAAFSAGGAELLHVNHSQASPRDVVISPYLYYQEQI